MHLNNENKDKRRLFLEMKDQSCLWVMFRAREDRDMWENGMQYLKDGKKWDKKIYAQNVLLKRKGDGRIDKAQSVLIPGGRQIHPRYRTRSADPVARPLALQNSMSEPQPPQSKMLAPTNSYIVPRPRQGEVSRSPSIGRTARDVLIAPPRMKHQRSHSEPRDVIVNFNFGPTSQIHFQRNLKFDARSNLGKWSYVNKYDHTQHEFEIMKVDDKYFYQETLKNGKLMSAEISQNQGMAYFNHTNKFLQIRRSGDVLITNFDNGEDVMS
eukprot:UN32191